ncbi:MAG: isopenicillin N synthase family dioxygenase [Granulosicoccus sp.]
MKNIPVIDIAGLLQSIAHDSADTAVHIATVSESIKHAMNDSGFFYISGLSLKSSVLENVLSAQRTFFALTPEQKNESAINQDNRGYLASGMAKMHGAKTHDQKEVFFWGPDLPESHLHMRNKVPLCANNQWPQQISEFRKAVLDYAAMIKFIGNALLRAIAHCLDLNDRFFESRYQDSLLRGQLIRYPQTHGTEENFGVAPHTDFGCLTFLLQQTSGLEVLSGGEWIAAPPIEGTLVVNIGDLLARWSDDRLPSNVHRVRNNSTEERFSIAVFHDPDPTVSVAPADMNSDTCGYATVSVADYILGRNSGAFSHYGNVSKTSGE